MRLRLVMFLLLAIQSDRLCAQTTIGNWVNTGPILFPVNVSGQVNGMGRVSQVKFHPNNSQKMYAVSASGGLFISLNNGLSWAPTAGTEVLPQTSCSSVCIDYTNDSIIYLSTGDANYYGDSYGIWKSTNGGLSFASCNNNIGNRMAVEILMDPLNHNTLIAATTDGIWKSTNAGLNWTETHVGDAFKDMKRKPGSNSTVYAVSGLNYYISNDFGSNWTNITNGLLIPQNNGGLRLAVSAADTNVVYIATTDSDGVVMRSTDGGLNFSVVYADTSQCLVCYDQSPASGSQGNYNFSLTANPLNANEVILVSHCVWRSTDGGSTWSKRTSWWNECHTDMHDIEFNPYNNSQRFNANDGGVWLTTDTACTLWHPRSDGLSATEVYHAAQSNLIRQMVSSGTQDNGELYFDNVWKCNRGGDWGPVCNFDFLPGANVYYVGSGNRRSLQPLGGDQSYNSPFSPTNNAAIEFYENMTNMAFIAADSLWRSTDINTSSPSWSLIGPFNETVQSMSLCHADSNLLYVVTNNNHIHKSINALAATPIFTTISTPYSNNNGASIATYKPNANVVYISCNNRVYRSGNKGLTWTNITYNLPNLNIRKIIVDDYSSTERVFVNMGSYVYYKDNTSNTWTITNSIPTVPNVTDMMCFNNGTSASILRLSTYGRGVWELNINNNLPPVADFASDKQYICPGDTVHYFKTIFGPYNSFVWNFPGGNPSTSTADSPVVIYAGNGNFDARLIALSNTGNDTMLKTNYIVVSNGYGNTVQEGFEGSTFTPAGWETQVNSGLNWQRVDTVGGYGLSLHCAFYDNFNHDAGGKQDRLITPQLDLNNALYAFITFDVAYCYYPGYRDTLEVSVSTDCNRSFTPLYLKDTTLLATAPNTGNFFVPTATQWRTDTVWLTPYLGQSISVAFNNIGHYGQTLYIDNVNLNAQFTGIKNINVAGQLQVYPNPAHTNLKVKASGLSGSKVYIEVLNIVGTVVKSQWLNVSAGELNTVVNVQGWVPGMYQIKLQSEDGGRMTTPFIVQ